VQVRDVMTKDVISVQANEFGFKAARLMLLNWISGLPVTDGEGKLVGIVTEGDFLRRSEIGMWRRLPEWFEFVVWPGRLDDEYMPAPRKKVEEFTTRDPLTVAENDSLESAVALMEQLCIKHLPVMRNGRMVGIVSRANLMHAAKPCPQRAGAHQTRLDDSQPNSGGSRKAALGPTAS